MSEISVGRRFAVAVSSLTIFPLARGRVWGEEVGSSMVLFPVVGLLLGVLLWLCAAIFRTAFNPEINALFILVVLTIVTRGLYLDDLAAVLDGFGRGQDREKVLQSMGEDRRGTFGIMGLVLVLLGKYLLINQLIQADSLHSLLLFPVIGRWSMISLSHFFPSIQRPGRRSVFTGYLRPKDIWWATGITMLISLFTHGLAGLGTMALVWVVVYFLGHYFVWRMEGITEEVVGAAEEVAEIVSLATIVALLRGI